MCGNLITKSKKGFLLVEVLISVMILSIGLVSITRSFMMSLKALDIVSQYEEARALIEEKLWNLEAAGTIESGVNIEENFFEPYEEFSYILKTENIEEDDGQGLLNNVFVSVNWPTGQGKREISIETFLKNIK